MGLIYLDSCVLIYALEDASVFGRRTRAAVASFPSSRFAISPLVAHEVLVLPIRRQSIRLMSLYESQFAAYQMLDLALPEYIRAAELRAANPGLKAMDALHLATAQLAGCDALWTNDKRLSAASAGLAVDIIGDAGAQNA